jgi:glycosyltransferase involved in cell wall biosynthesis
MARICVIRQAYVPLDTRVRRETQALAAAGYRVDVICLRRPGEPMFERRGAMTMWRLPLARPTGGLVRRLAQYGGFLALAGALAGVLHLRHRYDVVQANSVPDALVLAAALPKLLGARVLLDLHECVPEFFAAKYDVSLDSRGPRCMAAVEQACIRFADLAITCTDGMRDRFVSRGAPADKLSVVLNGADEEVFDPQRFPEERSRRSGPSLISHGTVEERYGLDTIIGAVALLRDELPDIELTIIGEGSYRGELQRLATERGVADRVSFSPGFLPLDDLVRAIARADIGVVAIKRDEFRDLSLCNKMYDFIAMRTPAVVSRTTSVEDYFGDGCFEMFRSGDEADLARAILRLAQDPDRHPQLTEKAAEAASGHRWPVQRERYLGVVSRLVGAGDAGRAPSTS